MIFPSLIRCNSFMKRFPTHVYRNFFTPHSISSHITKLCPFVWEHSVLYLMMYCFTLSLHSKGGT